MSRVYVSVARKGNLAIYEASEDRDEVARIAARDLSATRDGWTRYSEPQEFVSADEVARLIAEAVAAARRAA